MIKKEFKGYEVSIEHALLILLNIEDFISFSRDIKYIDILEIDNIVSKLCNGKTFMINNQSREFFYNHQAFINNIKVHTTLFNFITQVYDQHANINEAYVNFYEYLTTNKSAIEKIHEVLLAIKRLDIPTVRIDENEKFDMLISFDSGRYSYSDFAYGENMRIVPTYEKNTINYYFDGTNYIIPLINDFDNIRLFSKTKKEIIVNNLLFDPKALPLSLNRDNTLGVLLNLRDEHMDSIKLLKEDVDLSFSISDLLDELDNSTQVVKGLTQIKERDEIINYLNDMRTILTKIKTIQNNSEEEIVKDDSNTITQDIINQEKEDVVKRRIYSRIDIH